MKQQLFTLLLFITSLANAQIIKINDYNGKTVNFCKGQFVGSGFSTSNDFNVPGFSGYDNNENNTITFCTTPGKQIRTNFFFYGIAAGDHLYVYDGSSTSSPLLADLTNRQAKFPGDNGQPAVFTSTASCLTFKFTSNGSGTSFGWDAFIGCTPESCIGNPPASDECISATEICNLGGYCGSTSGWYTRGVEAKNLDGSPANTTGFCGEIHNNSWLSFIAATTSASFDIISSNCSDPKNGIQAVIFGTSDCKNFIRISDSCKSNAIGKFTLSSTKLIPNQKYYIMIDGAYGNDCDYTILATSGVKTLNLSASTSNTLCTGQPLTLVAHATGIGPFTYDWSPTPVSGQGDSLAVFTVAAATTYTCTVTGVCGTPTAVMYTPSANITPIVSSADSSRICPGGPGTKLTATSILTSPTINFTNTLTKIISDNDPAGTNLDINVGNITGLVGNQLLKVGVNIKHGDVSELDLSLKAPDNSIINLSTGKVSGANYIDTYFSPTAASSITTGTAPFTGTYLPEDSFSKLSGSAIDGRWSLIVKDKKAFNTGLITGWSLSFKNEFNYSWAPPTGLSTTTDSVVFATPTSTTTYTISLSDKAGCVGDTTVTVFVTIPTKPLVTSPVIYCEGDSSLPLTAIGNDLLWYTSATGGTGSPTAPKPPTIKPDTIDYYVSHKTLTCEGEREKITVIINPAPELSGSNTAKICSGIQLNVPLKSSINCTWSWQATDNNNTTGETYSKATNSDVINDVIVNNTPNEQIVKYTVNLKSITTGCVSITPQEINVTVNKVKAIFTATPETGEMPLLIQFSNTSTTSTGVSNYTWDFGMGNTSSQTNPTFTYDALGKYKVCLTISDGQCVDSSCATTITVFINSLLIIPNVFTPNGDGVNDVLTILGKGISSLHGEIYNRWGQKEYEWDTPKGGWDGYSPSGKPASQGTYFVIINAVGLDGKTLLEKGSITLLR